MRSSLRILFIIGILYVTAFAQTETPVLIAPINQSEFQKSKNLEFRWNPVPTVSTYRFELSTDTTFNDPLLIIDATGNVLTIDLLEYNTIYFWRIKGMSPESPWSEKWSFKTTIQPAKPLIYSPDSHLRNQPDSMVFRWNSSIGNTSYLLQLSFSPDFSKIEKNIYSSDTSIVVRSLLKNHFYFWKVRAFNSNFDESQWSETRYFKTELPSAISFNTDSLRNTDTALTLSWTKIDSADQFLIRFAENKDLVQSIDPVSINENSFIADKLEFKKWYYWQVLALNFAGDSSDWSRVYSFKTKLQDQLLTNPENRIKNTDTSITFTWQPVEHAEKYLFQLAEDEQFTNIVADTVMKNYSLKVDSLLYSQSYYWRVNAFNNDGDSSRWSETYEFRTRLIIPDIVNPLNNTNDQPLNTELKWNASERATHYQIQVSNEALFEYPILDTSITRTSYKLSRLIPDTIYYCRILAYNSIKDSSLWTPLMKFRTIPAIKISIDSLNVVKNLSVDPSDTLGYISIKNSGINTFDFEQIYVQPDTLFYLNVASKTVMPASEEKYTVRINTKKIQAGYSTLLINIIRLNIENIPDTVTLTQNVLIRKAVAKIQSDTIIFRNTSALDSSLHLLMINNIKSNIPLIIKKISISGNDTSSFKIRNTIKSIQANDSLSLKLSFIPDHKGINNAYLDIETNSFPVRNLRILLRGYGRGGELAAETYASVKTFAADSFETFTENNRNIFFYNTGNEQLNLSIRSARDYFKPVYDFQRYIQIKPGDTLSVKIKYITPNFKLSNTDTLFITHNGFGKDTILAVLKGTFDSAATSGKLVNELLLNNSKFYSSPKYMEKNSQFNLSYNPELFTGLTYLSFRMKYYKGGNGSPKVIYGDLANNFYIPKNEINEKGFLLWGELIIRDEQNRIKDSVVVLPPTDFQVILRNYKTNPVSVPKSVPAENSIAHKTKWVMFGFPFYETVADSVFGYLGGISKQKDGEWIIYQYNSWSEVAFSTFNSYAFEPMSGYIIAQALLDTFKITYNYLNNVATRRLTDTLIKVPGDRWKIISNPYLFDVEVDPSITLMKYDYNYNSYRMTNIMKPGEAYFVEPAVTNIRLKTYGRYNPFIYPGIISKTDWHLKITGATGSSAHEVYVSFNAKGLAKENHSSGHSLPPSINRDVEFYIKAKTDEKLQAAITNSSEGEVWDLIINSQTDQTISLRTDRFGNFPEEYVYEIYDPQNKSLIKSDQSVFLKAGQENIFKIITGTSEFVNSSINNFNEIPAQFYLYQNYPNPFNSSTVISYNLPADEKVNLKLYDILGREAAVLVDSYQNAGTHQLKVDLHLSAGVYIYKIKAGTYTHSRKMILLK